MAQSAVGYIRVSSDQQVQDGISLDAQRGKIAAYCELHDIPLRSVFCDAGLSGKRSDNRPELQKALSETCSVGGILIVFSLSRLARSTQDTLQIADRLAKSGSDLVSLSEKIDTSGASGKLVFRLFAALAEFERDLCVERTTVALRHKKQLGERTGGVPFGFTLADDGVRLIPSPAEQDAIALIGNLRRSGQSLEKIAAELNRLQIPTKQGKGSWGYTSVRSILKRTCV